MIRLILARRGLLSEVLFEFAERSYLRVYRRTRRVHRHAASAIRFGLGSRLFSLDGGLRHCRRAGARPASLLSGHGLLGEEMEDKHADALGRAASRTAIKEKLFQKRRDLCSDLSIVFINTSLSFLRRGRRDARRTRLFQGLPARSEADDPRLRRRRHLRRRFSIGHVAWSPTAAASGCASDSISALPMRCRKVWRVP